MTLAATRSSVFISLHTPLFLLPIAQQQPFYLIRRTSRRERETEREREAEFSRRPTERVSYLHITPSSLFAHSHFAGSLYPLFSREIYLHVLCSIIHPRRRALTTLRCLRNEIFSSCHRGGLVRRVRRDVLEWCQLVRT